MKIRKLSTPLFITACVIISVFLIAGAFVLFTDLGTSNGTKLRVSSGAVGQSAAMDMSAPTAAPAPGVAFYEESAARNAIIEPPRPPSDGAPAEDRERIGERIIQSGSIHMRVDDATKRLEEIRSLVDNVGGFIADASISDNVGVKTANLTARIPADQYQSIRSQIRAIGSTIFNETSRADDVTAQFVDLDARLSAAQAEEQQYLEILSQADTVEDTLKITSQLAQVRSRIEQMEGQLRYLRDRTEFATLSVRMTEETRVEIPTDEWRPGEVLRQSLRDLVVVGQSLANLLISASIFIVGLILPIGLVIWFVVWLIKRIARALRKKKK